MVIANQKGMLNILKSKRDNTTAERKVADNNRQNKKQINFVPREWMVTAHKHQQHDLSICSNQIEISLVSRLENSW